MIEDDIRVATRTDLPALIALLKDDTLGQGREGEATDPGYAHAMAAIEVDPNNDIYVVERDGQIIGCAQLTIIPGLSRRGANRAQIESVRVASQFRGAGLGRQLIEALISIAYENGCSLVQLTSDKERAGAQKFYESLGFVASHEGYKLSLSERG